MVGVFSQYMLLCMLCKKLEARRISALIVVWPGVVPKLVAMINVRTHAKNAKRKHEPWICQRTNGRTPPICQWSSTIRTPCRRRVTWSRNSWMQRRPWSRQGRTWISWSRGRIVKIDTWRLEMAENSGGLEIFGMIFLLLMVVWATDSVAWKWISWTQVSGRNVAEICGEDFGVGC